MLDGLQPLRLLVLLVAGLAAGFINVNAGGGSLITLPALIFLGLPTTMANATNRVGLVLQNTVSSSTFARRGRLPLRLGLLLLIPSIPGAYLGTRIALELDEVWFRRILAAILLFVLVTIVRKPSRSESSGAGDDGRAENNIAGEEHGHTGMGVAPKTSTAPSVLPAVPHPYLLAGSFFLLGIYAGVIQAGAGFLLIAAINRLGGLDLVRTNAVKVFVVLFLQVLALGIFWSSGQVRWLPGIVLGAGTMLGGYAGTHTQMKHGEVWVRRFLIACVLVFAAKLLADSF